MHCFLGTFGLLLFGTVHEFGEALHSGSMRTSGLQRDRILKERKNAYRPRASIDGPRYSDGLGTRWRFKRVGR